MSTKNKTEETVVKTEDTREPDQFSTGQSAGISMKFTDAELKTLSNGILSLIEKTTQAKALIPDEKVHMVIDGYCTKLQALNTRVCRCV